MSLEDDKVTYIAAAITGILASGKVSVGSLGYGENAQHIAEAAVSIAEKVAFAREGRGF